MPLSSFPISQSILKTHLFFHGRKFSTPNNRIRINSGVPKPLLTRPGHCHTTNIVISCQVRHSSFLSLHPLHRHRLSLSSMSSLSDGHHSTLTPTNKTVRVVVKGRVQGVFYRNWTIENAKELGLKGWVRNRRDGSVEALFSGSPDKVQDMEQRCRRGPAAAMVTALEVSPCSDDPGTGFDRRQTI